MRLKYKIRFAALAVIVIIGIAFYAVANNSESLNTTNVDFEDVKAEILKIFDGFEFKPYTYYEGLTDSLVKDTEKAE